MSIKGMNHAVLYVRDAKRHQRFYEDLLDFVTVIDGPGPFVFMRGPASQNHHDIAFFAIGQQADASEAGQRTVGLYHIAWEVGTLDELITMQSRLEDAGVLIGASDHGANLSLYSKDPDGIEFEVMWLVPAEHWGDEEHEAIIRPLDLHGMKQKFEALAGPGAGQ